MEDETPAGNVIRFPRQLRVVPVAPAAPKADPAQDILVEHNGRPYRFADLARRSPLRSCGRSRRQRRPARRKRHGMRRCGVGRH